jgi:hypothetical protein
MEEKSKVDSLLLHAKEYVEERIRLVTLEIHDKVTRTLSGIVMSVIISLLSIFVILFFSFALAWWIGRELEGIYIGFLVVGGFYLLVAILIYVNRDKWIATPVMNIFIKNITANEEKD